MTMRRVYAHLGLCALTLGNFSLSGCRYFPESTFDLANDSRPPKWITIPPSLDRKNVKVSMSYYISPWGGKALFTLKDGAVKVESVDGKTCGTFTFAGSNGRDGSTYPAYQAVIANGMTEIVEHRAMEPIFRITDEPAVWQRYSALGCNSTRKAKKAD